MDGGGGGGGGGREGGREGGRDEGSKCCEQKRKHSLTSSSHWTCKASIIIDGGSSLKGGEKGKGVGERGEGEREGGGEERRGGGLNITKLFQYF